MSPASTSRRYVWPLLGLCLLGLASESVAAAEPLFGGIKTLGGPVHWTDHILHGDWRIQRNVLFGRYRLLDPKNRKIVSGTLDECFHELDTRRVQGRIPPMSQHVVIVMHGLAGTRHLMSGLAKHLHAQGGYTVLNFGYASTQGTIEEHTLALESVLRNLQGVSEVSFVGHSMSNIMVRHLLFRLQHCETPLPLAFRRMVMISPPNHGAELADSLGQGPLAQLTMGPVVDQMAPSMGWPALQSTLATPPFEFGILMGGKGNEHGYLHKIPGDDDMLLSLRTQYLAGASDLCQVGGIHQLMPKYEDTQRATLNFLNYGHF